MLRVEAEFDALIADGHSRTDASLLLVERAAARAAGARVVVLVEGISDQIALEVIADRLGRDLATEGVAVVPMGGATNIARSVSAFRGKSRLAGLYDAAEEPYVRGALTAEELEGFFACERDLEEEFMRVLGTERVERLIEMEGRLRSFRTMQREPHHRGRSLEDQLYRFIGSRRYRWARLLAEAVEPDEIPQPLVQLLDYVIEPSGT